MRTLLASIGLAAAIATSASAATVTVDFEGFADGTNLHGVNLGGVTVTNPSGNVEIYANDRFGVSFNSPVNAIGSFTLGAESINPMVFTFDSAVSFVELYAGDRGGDDDSWTLEVFDAAIGGNSLGQVAFGPWNGSPYSMLSIAASGIRRAEAVWTGTFGIGFDDLTFTTATVPLPSTVLLLLPALAGLGLMRRRA